MLKCIFSFLSLFLLDGVRSASPAHKTKCVIHRTVVDCSHMNLDSIPQDLPLNITILDVSHNRLSALVPSSLIRYQHLEQLDASYNSLKAVPEGVCQAVPMLQHLSMRHNEVHLLQEADLRNCTGLTHLDLSDNRLRMKGEPFTEVSVGHTLHTFRFRAIHLCEGSIKWNVWLRKVNIRLFLYGENRMLQS